MKIQLSQLLIDGPTQFPFHMHRAVALIGTIWIVFFALQTISCQSKAKV